MKRFNGFSAVAVLALALAAMPVCAQPRGGGGSHGGSHGGGGGRSSSSMSAPSRGGGSSHYSSGPSRSYSSGSSRSYSSGSSRGYSSPQRQSGSITRGGSVPSQPRQSSGARVAPNNGRNGTSAPSRVYGSQPQTRSQSGVPHGGAVRSQNGQPQRGVQGGQPQRSVQSSQPRRSIQGSQPQRSITASGRPAPGVQRQFNGGQPQRVQMHSGGPGHGPEHGRIAPRHRDPMPFNRPSRFWDHGHHYFGYRVHYLPSRYHIHRYWGRDYYIIDGLYYRHYLDYYYVCRPPFGVFFDPVIDGIAYAACNFAYYSSVYNSFRTINENANTITAQNQVIAENNATIAQQNETIALNSERAAAAQIAADNAGLVQSYADASTEYFYDDGVFFVKDKSGKYVTIVPPAGALVKELPDDYDTITLDGKEYYKVDDTVFRTTVVDGTVYFEVLGQMTGELADSFDFNKQ